jgi:hypothetical protein
MYSSKVVNVANNKKLCGHLLKLHKKFIVNSNKATTTHMHIDLAKKGKKKTLSGENASVPVQCTCNTSQTEALLFCTQGVVNLSCNA